MTGSEQRFMSTRLESLLKQRDQRAIKRVFPASLKTSKNLEIWGQTVSGRSREPLGALFEASVSL